MTAKTRKVMACLTVLLLLVAVLNFGTAPRSAYSLSLGGLAGDILKAGGIGLLVSHFSGEINNGINSIMAKEGVMPQAKTKVVPIIRIGTKGGTAVGAAQVVGPPSQVDKVQGVAEGTISIGSLGGRVLIPTTTKAAYTESVRGVGGVGISANVKFKL